MFTNVRRGNVGLFSLIAVGMVLASTVAGAGLLVKAYREGGSSTPAACIARCSGALPGANS